MNLGMIGFEGRQHSRTHSLFTNWGCVAWIALIDRHAVLMKKTKRHRSVIPTYRVSFALMHTYGFSGDKVATSIIDIFIISDKLRRSDVPFASQTTARRTRGSGVERAHGLVHSRAEFITGCKGNAAYWHKTFSCSSSNAYARTYNQVRNSETVSQTLLHLHRSRSTRKYRPPWIRGTGR